MLSHLFELSAFRFQLHGIQKSKLSRQVEISFAILFGTLTAIINSPSFCDHRANFVKIYCREDNPYDLHFYALFTL